MVVASSNSAFGSTEETRPVKRPLMVLATLPRVLGPGESLNLPVTVFAMEPEIREVQVKLEGLELLEATQRTATLRFDSPGEQVANLQLRVPDQLGVAKLRVLVSGGGFVASDEVELQVRAPNPEVSVVQRAVIEPGETWTSSYTAPGMAGTNSGALEVSGSLPVNLEHRLHYLLQYPHGCLEQTVSGAFPQLFLADFTKLSDARAASVQRSVNAALRKLPSFHHGRGQFSYWPGQRNDYAAWAAAYAGHFMLEAERRGYRLPTGLLEAWRIGQKEAANAWNAQRIQVFAYELPATQAYRLYTLALAKSPQLGAMNRLRGNSNLDAVSTDFLAAAYALAGQRAVARELLASRAKSSKDAAYTRYTYGSEARDMAVSLYVHQLLGDRDNAFKLAQQVSNTLSTDRWLSTQATAWSLIAMARYNEEDDATQPLAYSYGLGSTREDITQGSNVQLISLPEPSPTAPTQFEFRNKGQRRAYVRLVTTGLPSTSQKADEAENLSMTISYTDLSGKALDVAELKQGQDFLAVTTFKHPGALRAYNELAYTQIFPSGWEIRNERLEGASVPTGLDYQDVRDDRVLSYFDLGRNKQLSISTQLTAAYSGRYYLPDRYCQAMYDRDIRARIPGQWVEVTEE